jgi:hypothetical protein
LPASNKRQKLSRDRTLRQGTSVRCDIRKLKLQRDVFKKANELEKKGWESTRIS